MAQERMKAGKANPTPKSVQGSKASRETDAVLASKAGVGKTKLREYEAVITTEAGRLRDEYTPEDLRNYQAAAEAA